jgi:hypothetical protein
MTEPPHDPEMPTAGTPRWVKVSAVIALIVVVVFVVLLIAGGHNPGSHTDGESNVTFVGAVAEH